MTHRINPDLLALAQPVDTLIPLPGNPRRGDVDAIAKSYEQFGQRKPIVARRADRTVLGGNHQLAAAVKLGWDQIAVVFVDDNDQTAAAYTLADNRTADLGTYDDALLVELLSAVSDDAELLAATGYTPGDLLVLAQEHGAPGSADFLEPQEDVYRPQYAVTVTVTDEVEQEALFNRLTGEGLNCRVVTV